MPAITEARSVFEGIVSWMGRPLVDYLHKIDSLTKIQWYITIIHLNILFLKRGIWWTYWMAKEVPWASGYVKIRLAKFRFHCIIFSHVYCFLHFFALIIIMWIRPNIFVWKEGNFYLHSFFKICLLFLNSDFQLLNMIFKVDNVYGL